MMLCRICKSSSLRLVIDLKNQPWGNHFLLKEQVGKESSYPLKLVYCENCQTSQLDFTVKKEIMFFDHTYLSGVTKTLANHFKQIAYEVDETFFKDQKEKNVLDIGSNDGTQLQFYQDLGYEVIGVESCKKIADLANQKGIFTFCKFFNLDTAQQINKKYDVINASGVFFHLEELDSVTEAIKKYLKKEGIFVVQFLYMKSIMDNVAFDQIYHEHLLYYTLQSLDRLLKKFDLEMFDAKLSPIHGGSIIGFVTHKEGKKKTDRLLQLQKEEQLSQCNAFTCYEKFAKNVKKLKEKNVNQLMSWKNQNKRIYGFGAPVKGNTLLNYFGINSQILDYLVEKNNLRKGLYSPGMHIPIILEQEIKKHPDIYYVLAWNFKEEILKNNQSLIEKGVEFYFPIGAK